MMEGLGLFGILVLVGDIYAILNIFQARSASTAGKVAWIALVLLLPLIGLIIWFLFGPRENR